MGGAGEFVVQQTEEVRGVTLLCGSASTHITMPCINNYTVGHPGHGDRSRNIDVLRCLIGVTTDAIPYIHPSSTSSLSLRLTSALRRYLPSARGPLPLFQINANLRFASRVNLARGIVSSD